LSVGSSTGNFSTRHDDELGLKSYLFPPQGRVSRYTDNVSVLPH